MKTRSIKVLLQLLLRQVKTNDLEDSGICHQAFQLYLADKISDSEHVKLSNYIDKHRPYKGIHFDPRQVGSLFFWKEGVRAPRVRWLKYRIAKH